MLSGESGYPCLFLILGGNVQSFTIKIMLAIGFYRWFLASWSSSSFITIFLRVFLMSGYWIWSNLGEGSNRFLISNSLVKSVSPWACFLLSTTHCMLSAELGPVRLTGAFNLTLALKHQGDMIFVTQFSAYSRSFNNIVSFNIVLLNVDAAKQYILGWGHCV